MIIKGVISEKRFFFFFCLIKFCCVLSMENSINKKNQLVDFFESINRQKKIIIQNAENSALILAHELGHAFFDIFAANKDKVVLSVNVYLNGGYCEKKQCTGFTQGYRMSNMINLNTKENQKNSKIFKNLEYYFIILSKYVAGWSGESIFGGKGIYNKKDFLEKYFLSLNSKNLYEQMSKENIIKNTKKNNDIKYIDDNQGCFLAAYKFLRVLEDKNWNNEEEGKDVKRFIKSLTLVYHTYVILCNFFNELQKNYFEGNIISDILKHNKIIKDGSFNVFVLEEIPLLKKINTKNKNLPYEDFFLSLKGIIESKVLVRDPKLCIKKEYDNNSRDLIADFIFKGQMLYNMAIQKAIFLDSEFVIGTYNNYVETLLLYIRENFKKIQNKPIITEEKYQYIKSLLNKIELKKSLPQNNIANNISKQSKQSKQQNQYEMIEDKLDNSSDFMNVKNSEIANNNDDKKKLEGTLFNLQYAAEYIPISFRGEGSLILNMMIKNPYTKEQLCDLSYPKKDTC